MAFADLMSEWAALAVSFAGWSLDQIQGLSRRERRNWLEIARELGKVVLKDG
jgi:hypothetical protein